MMSQLCTVLGMNAPAIVSALAHTMAHHLVDAAASSPELAKSMRALNMVHIGYTRDEGLVMSGPSCALFVYEVVAGKLRSASSDYASYQGKITLMEHDEAQVMSFGNSLFVGARMLQVGMELAIREDPGGSRDSALWLQREAHMVLAVGSETIWNDPSNVTLLERAVMWGGLALISTELPKDAEPEGRVQALVINSAFRLVNIMPSDELADEENIPVTLLLQRSK